MSETKWTKQDWLVDRETVYALNAEGTNRFSARVDGGWITYGLMRTEMEERAANAHLIASAPGLYQALALAVRQNSHDMLMTGDELRACESALAKARGEQP